jgi:hypothetical protein
MKKILRYGVIITALFSISLSVPVSSMASTLTLGVKYWYSFWDPAIAQYTIDNAKTTAAQMSLISGKATYANIKISVTPGHLLGPMIGFQSGNWSVSLAVMAFSYSFVTEQSGYFLNITDGLLVPISANSRTRRIDGDLAVGYSLSDYVKLFFGYKFQYMDLKLYDRLYAGPAAIALYGTDTLTMITHRQDSFHMPTAGFVFYLPLSERLIVSLQTGVLLVIPRFQFEKKDNIFGIPQSQSETGRLSAGVNSELSLNFRIYEGILMQLGYRFQVLWIPYESNEGVKRYAEIFHGVSASVVYAFNFD